jgi:hypothetical protein
MRAINRKRTMLDSIFVKSTDPKRARAQEISATEIVRYIESGEPFSRVFSSASDIS